MRAPLPGDLRGRALTARLLRVDHAGELGAARLYDGQLAVLGTTPTGAAIRGMANQERGHLETFERLLPQHRVRPTALSPLWHAAGFALGVASAAAGPRAAMACTVAVEEAIDAHYARQIAALEADPAADVDTGAGDTERPLSALLAAFRDDELAHRDTARAQGAATCAPLAALVKGGCRAAIWLSERL